MTENPLVTDYLRRLDVAARVLPPPQRAELVEEIRAHIAAGTAGATDQATVRNLLQRLGTPEEIVASARDDVPPPWGAPPPVAPWPARPAALGPDRIGAVEIGAVLMLSIGSLVLPGLGWLIGAVLLWISPVWKVWEKVLATLVMPGGIGVFLMFPLLPLSLPGPSSLIVIPLLMLLGMTVVSGYLLVVARNRVRAGGRSREEGFVASGAAA